MEEKQSRTVLVTGGNRGIGKGICLELARTGHDIILTYNHGKEEAENTVKDIATIGRKAEIMQIDLSKSQEIDDFTLKLTEKGIKLAGLVNNAGIYDGKPLQETDNRQWENTISLNLTAPFYLSRNLSRIITKGGSIVNIASVYGMRADPWAYGYQASKAALIHLTRGLAKELAPNIRVNAVAPGFVRTDMNRGGWESESFRGRINKATPMGRWGEPEDIGRAVAFLMDPLNDFITGHTMVIDGGIGL